MLTPLRSKEASLRWLRFSARDIFGIEKNCTIAPIKRGRNRAGSFVKSRREAVRAEAEALALANATEKERIKVRAEMKEKQVKEAGELERKIEEAKIEKPRATGVKGSG